MLRVAFAFAILFSFQHSNAAWSITSAEEANTLKFIKDSIADGIKNLMTNNVPLAEFFSRRLRQTDVRVVVGTRCGNSFCADACSKIIYVSQYHLSNLKTRKSNPRYILWWKNAIFHEFLHLMEVPTGNDVATVHNRVFRDRNGFVDHRMERDFVMNRSVPGKTRVNSTRIWHVSPARESAFVTESLRFGLYRVEWWAA